MERYQVTTHLERGSTNNLNDWAAAVGNPRYILDLLWSVINVGVQTVCGSPPDKPESDSNIQRRMLKT
jgi:predicted helicase